MKLRTVAITQWPQKDGRRPSRAGIASSSATSRPASLALEAVLLLGHPHGAEGEAVHGAAGDVGGEAGPGRELGALVVGEVEARGRVGLGEELEGGGLAGAGEGEDAQRAGGVGAACRDDGVLLGAGLQGGLRGAPCRPP